MEERVQAENMALTFRRMNLGDIDMVCAIEKEAFTTPWSPGAFYNELTNNHFAHYMIMQSGLDVAGYAGLWLIMDEAHITNIAVRKRYRGMKLGERLVRELMKTASFMGAVKITLEVRVTNEIAQNLYRKVGFTDSGVRKGYYTDNNEDALIMWADLEPYLRK